MRTRSAALLARVTRASSRARAQLLCALLATMCSVAAVAQTSSGFAFPPVRWGQYGIDKGAGLDTGCVFRSDVPNGELTIRFRVFATMNPAELDSAGKLKDPAKLVKNSVISETISMQMPVYDIDSDSGEVDEMYLNDSPTPILVLSGINQTWTDAWDQRGRTPIKTSQLRFTPDPKLQSGPENVLRIRIDTASPPGDDAWCMQVDWVSVSFDAAFPIVLAHGIASDASTWDDVAGSAPGVLTRLNAAGARHYRFSTGWNGNVAANAADLRTQIRQSIVDPLKVEKIHVIAHSKGGLDSQYMASISTPGFEVRSLSTLGTPHLGSVSADLTLVAQSLADSYILRGQDPSGYAQRYAESALSGLGSLFSGWSSSRWYAPSLPLPGRPGIVDLTTQAANAAVAAGRRGNVDTTFTIGSDAGPECAREPTDDELRPLLPNIVGSIDVPFVGDSLRVSYGAVCHVYSAKVLKTEYKWILVPGLVPPFLPLPKRIKIVTYSAAPAAPRLNDVVVPLYSSQPGTFGSPVRSESGTNHSEIKNGSEIDLLLPRILPLR